MDELEEIKCKVKIQITLSRESYTELQGDALFYQLLNTSLEKVMRHSRLLREKTVFIKSV